MFKELYGDRCFEENPNPKRCLQLCFSSALLSGSTMGASDWQKHRKGNGTVRSVRLQWREGAVDINKSLHLENKLHTKGFTEDLGGEGTPQHFLATT